MSLEALGDSEGALAAYRRYLARADAKRKTEATRRIDAITAQGAADGSGGKAATESRRREVRGIGHSHPPM